jgi:hypothetical protein
MHPKFSCEFGAFVPLGILTAGFSGVTLLLTEQKTIQIEHIRKNFTEIIIQVQ